MKKVLSMCLLVFVLLFSGCTNQPENVTKESSIEDAAATYQNDETTLASDIDNIVDDEKIVETSEADTNPENEVSIDDSTIEQHNDETTLASDIDNIVDNEIANTDTEVDAETKTSNVESAYLEACSLTIHDLDEKNSITGTNFYYKGLIIQSEDEEDLMKSWNTEHSLNQGAIYRTIAKALIGFKGGINSGENYAEIMCGIEWTSRAEFEPYVTNASEFICTENSVTQVMKKLQSLTCVSGSFDYENEKYYVTISDLTDCADEMMISEEMLGYIFAMLDEYSPAIMFDGNSCTIDFELYVPKNWG